MIFQFPSPVIFAHRGASAHAPENTLAAFELAVQEGAPAIEFDVKLTSDRQVIIHHDQTLERTTDGTGPVRLQTLAALRELDAGSWKSLQFKGEKIPLLSEVLEAVGNKVITNIELTNYASPLDGLAQEVAALVSQHGMQKRVLFSSFYFPNLMIARRLLPDVPCALLYAPGWQGWTNHLAGAFLTLEANHPYREDVNSNSVQRSHAHGRRVHVWTVNEPAEMRRLRECGADGIFTDDPLLGMEYFL